MRRRRTCLCGAQRATADQACLFGGCLGRQAQRWRGGRSRPLEGQAERAAPSGVEASADRREGTTEPAGSRPKGSMRSTRGATRPQAGGPHRPCNVDLAQDSGKPRQATHSNSHEPAPDLRLRVPMRNQKPGGGSKPQPPKIPPPVQTINRQAAQCARPGVRTLRPLTPLRIRPRTRLTEKNRVWAYIPILFG